MSSAAIVTLISPLLLAQMPLGADHLGASTGAEIPAPQDAAPADQGPTPEEAQPPSEDIDAEENEIVVAAEYGPPKEDPIERINAESYRITQEVDQIFVEPIAYAYRDGLPGPLRDGLGNVVRNLGEPGNALNYLLQFKVGKAAETLGRFAINSTLGVGGLFDFAKRPAFKLPYRRNGFGNTMGFYGVDAGPYLYLPFTGATSLRDVIGSGLDQLLLPVAVGEPFNTLEYAVPYFIINSLDARLEVDEELRQIRASDDPYALRRDTYLDRRRRELEALRTGEPIKPPTILFPQLGPDEAEEEAGEPTVPENAARGLEPRAARPSPQLADQLRR